MAEKSLSLETLGWNAALEESFSSFREKGFEPGRVAEEDKHHYVIFAKAGTFIGKVTGRFLHETKTRALLPKVGDWVAFSLVRNENEKAQIQGILPRRTKLSRKVPGRETEEQVLVTNVDVGFVVQALDQSFNAAQLQRHLAMVVEGGVKPAIVLNKADLCDDLPEKLATVKGVGAEAPVIAVSAKTGKAMSSLLKMIKPARTVVFIGGSGVGKSSLINFLYGEDILPTTEVRESDSKGRHTTSWRELIVLPNGGLVIDTPGMREFQMWLAGETGQEAFADIEAIALGCHFRSCGHVSEKRCAVLEAVEKGVITKERYTNYIKLKRELTFLDAAARQKRYIENKRAKGAERSKLARKPMDIS
ncbi:MAG: ribosome small subunit-dependent GTPase A [Akkermansiaceae bacterium]|nr:ribosome small subunit-dependent GTPase A [Verrucomicrobiales bacterium]